MTLANNEIHSINKIQENTKIDLSKLIPSPPETCLNELDSFIGQIDSNFNIISANQSLISLLSQGKINNSDNPGNLSNFITPEKFEQLRQNFSQISPEQSTINLEMELYGQIYGLRLKAIYNSENQVDHYTFNGREITEKYHLQQALENEAFTDYVTGLYNRRYQDEQLKNLGRSGEINGATIFMLDIDNFKTINDSLGHDEGDKILHLLGDTLKSIIHSTDIAARFGGDEATLILPNLVNPKDIQRFAYRLQETLIENNLHISFGFATAIKNDPSKPIDLFLTRSEADHKLQMMKKYKGEY